MTPKLSSKAQQFPLDRISTLPQPIIETILCLVPIKDAVRTSILSTNWRYNWTTIPKLVFNERYMFDKSNDEHQLEQSPNETKKLTSKTKVFSAIHQVPSLHQGPILEFSFTMITDNTCNEIDQIITYLSRNNTVKKFTLILVPHRKYSLPSSFYTLHHLTDLHLHNYDFYPKPTFKGFPNLTSLHMTTEHLSVKSIARLLSLSPLLKSFTLMLSNGYYLLERNTSMFEIFKYLAVIEHLSLHMSLFRGICEEEEEEEAAPQERPSALVHLKYLCLCEMFCAESGLPFLVDLIRSSPNLEKIKLQMHTYRHLHSNRLQGTHVVTPPGYSNIWLEHLNELEIEKFLDDECEMEFVKLILVKSPVLKKVNIVLDVFYDFVVLFNDEEVSRILLRSPRASPVAEINVEHPLKVENQG